MSSISSTRSSYLTNVYLGKTFKLYLSYYQCFGVTPLWRKTFRNIQISEHILAEPPGLKCPLVPMGHFSWWQNSSWVSYKVDHLSTFSNFIKRIPGRLYPSLCSFFSNPCQSLACISLLPIQDSRFSFLSLMVLMTLRSEVWHLPRTTLLHFISLLSLWRTSWSANLALAWPSDCDVGPTMGKLESAYFRK